MSLIDFGTNRTELSFISHLRLDSRIAVSAYAASYYSSIVVMALYCIVLRDFMYIYCSVLLRRNERR